MSVAEALDRPDLTSEEKMMFMEMRCSSLFLSLSVQSEGLPEVAMMDDHSEMFAMVLQVSLTERGMSKETAQKKLQEMILPTAQVYTDLGSETYQNTGSIISPGGIIEQDLAVCGYFAQAYRTELES